MSFDSVLSVLVNSWVRDMNVLLNTGPDGHGTIVEPLAAVLRQVGAFLQQNGQAVYGTRGPSTARSGTPTATTPSTCTFCLACRQAAWQTDPATRLPGATALADHRASRCGI